ncbi:MAG: Hsp20/alpha crystallin family protein [Bacillota bacterium]
MFDMVPFRRSGRQLRKGEDPMDRLLSNFFDDSFGSLAGSFKTDIIEKEDRFLIEAELPGMEKEDINIELEDQYLTISANKSEEVEQEEDNYIRRERRSGSFQRSFYLENVREEDINAEYDNGVLRVTLPKEKPTEPTRKTIEIE